jgi:hypothetical protein
MNTVIAAPQPAVLRLYRFRALLLRTCILSNLELGNVMRRHDSEEAIAFRAELGLEIEWNFRGKRAASLVFT